MIGALARSTTFRTCRTLVEGAADCSGWNTEMQRRPATLARRGGGRPQIANAAVSLTRPSYWGKTNLPPQRIVGDRPTLRLVGFGLTFRNAWQLFGFAERRHAEQRLRIRRDQPPQRL